MKKRLLSAALALCMALAMLPATALADEAELTQLAKPTNLQWGTSVDGESSYRAVPGYMNWTVEGDCQNRFLIKIYNAADDTNPVETGTHNFGSSSDISCFSAAPFITSDLDSGTYYFTIQSKGDGTVYSDSEIATSPTWTYVKPEAQLETLTGASWDWPDAAWSLPDNTDNILGYEVEYYFSETEDGEPRAIGSTRGNSSRLTTDQIPDSYVQGEGEGYYYFRVRANSNDITTYQNSRWTELCAAYNLTDVYSTVTDSLKEILNNADNADVREALQETVNTQDLKDAMLADQDNSGVVNLIAQLEESAGGQAAVVADDGFTKLDPAKVSVVGANLNTTGESTATLHIGDAKEGTVPEQYQNAVAFSMTVTNVEDPENLAVPVKITLPVPETIDPDFLVIVHYHNDGTTDTLEGQQIYIYEGEDGQWYVDIVVTSFSDFIMAESKQEIPDADFTTGVKGDWDKLVELYGRVSDLKTLLGSNMPENLETYLKNQLDPDGTGVAKVLMDVVMGNAVSIGASNEGNETALRAALKDRFDEIVNLTTSDSEKLITLIQDAAGKLN